MKISSRLWFKCSSAVIMGLVLSVSLMMNAFYLVPFSAGTRILTGVLMGFFLWGSFVVYCLSKPAISTTFGMFGVAFVVSVLLNMMVLIEPSLMLGGP